MAQKRKVWKMHKMDAVVVEIESDGEKQRRLMEAPPYSGIEVGDRVICGYIEGEVIAVHRFWENEDEDMSFIKALVGMSPKALLPKITVFYSMKAVDWTDEEEEEGNEE